MFILLYPSEVNRSLGTFMILDPPRARPGAQGCLSRLGYWI